MGSIIDRKINKEITHGLNANEVIGFANNAYTLPNFEKNEKGEYVFVGNQTISTLAEYSQYIQKYAEISDFIKSKYKPVIAKIYKNALNTLISMNDKYYLSKNRYTSASKYSKPFTIGKIADENPVAYEDLLSYITRAAYEMKEVKPCVEIMEILASSQKDFSESEVLYVLPQIGDNGVILYPKRGNSDFIEAQYELISQLDAKAIENFMFETASSLDKDTSRQVKNHIAKIFDISKSAGSKINSDSPYLAVDELADLTRSLIELVGADLSAFEKVAFATNPEIMDDEYRATYGDLYNDGSAKNHGEPEGYTSGAESMAYQATNFTADEILIRGSFKTSPAIVGDVIVTKLTPEGVKFDVTFESDKLFVQNASSEKANKGDSSPEL